jgi:hypothetical protein
MNCRWLSQKGLTSNTMNANHRTRINKSVLFSSNVRQARRIWGALSGNARRRLKELSERHFLEVAAGDLQLLDSRWYVTHAGLLRIAHRHSCSGIRTILQKEFCSPAENRWVFKATVYKSPRSKGFVGYGDADPSNVSPVVRGAEMRVAETRAVNRALRKAYGIGLCSVEELGWESKTDVQLNLKTSVPAANNNGHQNGNPRLRDRLCLLIRQHQLDANLVKAYAADSCGTPNLCDATREQIESFITNLAEWATKDRPALLCKLNSYSRSQEVTS